MKKSKIAIIITIIIIISSVLFYIYSSKNATADKENTYTSVKITKNPLEVTITATGEIKAIVQIDVKSEIGGKVIKLPHDEGEIVKKGDLLAIIDDTQLKQTSLQTSADYKNNLSKLEEAQIALELQEKSDNLSISSKQEELEKALLNYNNTLTQLNEQKEITTYSIDKAKSSLNVSQKELKKVIAGSRTQEIAETIEQVNQAKVTMEKANNFYERQKELYSKDYVSLQDVDDAEKAYLVAKSQYESAKQQYDMTEEGSRTEDIEISKSQVEQAEKNLNYEIIKGKQDIATQERALEVAKKDVNAAKIALEQAIAQGLQTSMKSKEVSSTSAQVDKSKYSYDQALDELSKTKILSPVNALIVNRSVEVGDVVASQTQSSAAGTTLMTIADLGEIYAETNIDESDIGKIKIGLPVTITPAAYQGLKIPGIVTHITPQATQVEQIPTFKIRIKILLDKIKTADLPPEKERYELLYPGMSVDADIYVAKKDSVLQVTREAVWEKNGKKYVTLVAGKNSFKDVEVTTGINNTIMVEIQSGVKEGDEIRLPDINKTPTVEEGPGGPPPGGP